MVDASLVQQVLPRRLAAKQASASITQQLDDSDSDAAHTPNSSPSPNRVTIKYGRKAKAMRKRMGHESEVKRSILDLRALDTTTPDLNGTTKPLKRRGRPPKKRPLLQDSNGQGAGEPLGSPLTPVSDANTFSSTLSPPPTSPAPPSLTPRPFPVMGVTDNGTNSSNHNAGGKRKRREPSGPKKWKKKDLGDFVWVLIDDQSRIYDHDKTATEREHVWWPGRIRPPPGGGRRILVCLYGQAALVKDIEVNRPTEDNILPFNDSAGEARFRVPTYVTPSRNDGSDVMMSPRKKAKRDRHELGERWNSAVLELNAERNKVNAIPGGVRPGRAPDSTVHLAASEDESLPEVGEMDWKASLASIPGGSQGSASPAKEKQKESVQKRKGRGKGKRKATPISEGESDVGIRRLEEDALCLSGRDDLFAHHIDETLQIPGELILAKGTNSDKNYWPARVLEYVPQKSNKEKEGKYKIEYLDGFTSVVDRNAFYTSEEDRFGTCKLGKFESSYDDTVNDSETEGVFDPPSQTRHPSPIPANPPPSKEAFFELDMHSQLVYTKPVLVAILNEQYAPARERHDQFLKGGQARKSIVDSAMLRGEIVPESVGELQRRLCEWCLREMLGKEDQKKQVAEKVEELQVDGAETSHGQLETSVVTEDTIESEEATGPPSLVTTSTTLPPEGPPDPSSVDVTMEDVTDKDSPLSTLSNLTNEVTPTPPENKEVKMLEESDDATESMSDLTELEDPAPSAPQPDAPVSETLPGLPRQNGCPAYEALTSMEKLEYCLNVLLPEAILQILLWRKGLRTATEILSQDEEERLHAEGAKLLHVTDWVYDVVRLRRLHERKFARQNSKDGMSSSQKSDRGGGRLRKVGRVNYHE